MILNADGSLRTGWYSLPDGRRFYGMGAADLREFCQKGWERQAVADRQLSQLLDSQRSPGEFVGPGGRGQAVFVDLFAAGELW